MRNTVGIARILRILAYRRVSTREQGLEGTSLEAQKTEIERYCKAHDLPEPIDYVEVESGGEESEEKRREVQRLLTGIRPGDAVIVSKIDRFGRDMVFIVKHVRAIRKKGACFISIAENFDSRRPESEMMLAAWAMAADMERRRIQERTQGPRKLLREQGLFVEGSVPFGYERPKDGSRRLVVAKEDAEIILDMFKLAANGKSIIQIRNHLRATYPGKLAFVRSWILRALHNPIYTGKISKTPVKPEGYGRAHPLPGEWIDSHDPIVPSDLFAIVQRSISGRARGRRPTDQSDTAHYLMRGIARCAFCKSVISPLRRSGRHRSGYYVCNKRLQASQATGEKCGRSVYLRQDSTDEMLATSLGVYMKGIKRMLARPPVQANRPDFSKRRAEVTRKRDNVLKLVAEGLVTIDAATNTLRAIETELASVDAMEGEFNASLSQDTAENRRGALSFIDQVADEWNALTIDVRRAVLNAVAREITVGSDKQPRIVWKEAGELAVDYAIGALPALRTPILKTLPAPRARLGDLLDAAQPRDESHAARPSAAIPVRRARRSAAA